ncbi:MAG: hypothetical protein ACI8QC_001835 [Planctomycetota bacterium]|jgi:hypothetical protein
MKLLALNCNQCGAPLEVPEKANFLTCAFCSVRLAVKRTDSAAYTEVLEAIDERTERIAEDVETIKLQNKLERLDREWSEQRQSFMTLGQDGVQRIPSGSGSLAGSLMGVIGGIVFMGVLQSIQAPSFMMVFGVIFIIVAFSQGVIGGDKAGRFQRGQAAYQAERRKLLDELDGAAA